MQAAMGLIDLGLLGFLISEPLLLTLVDIVLKQVYNGIGDLSLRVEDLPQFLDEVLAQFEVACLLLGVKNFLGLVNHRYFENPFVFHFGLTVNLVAYLSELLVDPGQDLVEMPLILGDSLHRFLFEV